MVLIEIKCFKDNYYVSNTGEIFRKLSPYRDSNGYMIFKDKYKKHHLIHRLVAKLFLPYTSECDTLEINHKDGNRANNNVDNLEWVTHSENIRYSYENLGQTPVRNYVECSLFHNNIYIGDFESKRAACRYAAKRGAKYSMINKHNKHNGWEIRCIDYPVGE